MEKLQSKIPGFKVRFATRADAPLILKFIRDLASFEKLLHEVVATEEDIERTLFGEKPYSEVLIGEYEGVPVSFALFFHTYSTFLGKPGIYLEDLYVDPKMRGRGLGLELLKILSSIALERNCGRMEWRVLNWNKDAIRFYERLGAKSTDEWSVYRLAGDALQGLAK